MEKYRYYSLSGLKVLIDRIDSNEIYFTIFKFRKNHSLWGEIWDRASSTECIKLSLSKEERSSCSYHTSYLGRFTTIPIYIKNVDTFDINSHCDLLIENYLTSKLKSDKLKDKVTDLLQQILHPTNL